MDLEPNITQKVIPEFKLESLARVHSNWHALSKAIGEYILGNWSSAARGLDESSRLFSNRGCYYISALCTYWSAMALKATDNANGVAEMFLSSSQQFIKIGAYEYALDSIEMLAQVDQKILNAECANSIHSILQLSYHASDFDAVQKALLFAHHPQKEKWIYELARLAEIKKARKLNPSILSEEVNIENIVKELYQSNLIPENAWPIDLAIWHGCCLSQKDLASAYEWQRTLNWQQPPRVAKVSQFRIIQAIIMTYWRHDSSDLTMLKDMMGLLRELAFQLGYIDQFSRILAKENLRNFSHDYFIEKSLIEAGLITFFWDEIRTDTIPLEYPLFIFNDNNTKLIFEELNEQNIILEKISDKSISSNDKIKMLSTVISSLNRLNKKELISRLAYVQLWKALLSEEKINDIIRTTIVNTLFESSNYHLCYGNYFGSAHLAAVAYNASAVLSKSTSRKHPTDSNSILSKIRGYELLFESGQNTVSHQMAHSIAYESCKSTEERIRNVRSALFFVFSEQERKGNIDGWPVSRAAAHIESMGSDFAADIRHLQMAGELYRNSDLMENYHLCFGAVSVHSAALSETKSDVKRHLSEAILHFTKLSHLDRLSILGDLAKIILIFIRFIDNPGDRDLRKLMMIEMGQTKIMHEDSLLYNKLRDLCDLICLTTDLYEPYDYRRIGRLLRGVLNEVIHGIARSHVPFIDRPLKKLFKEHVHEAFFDLSSEGLWHTPDLLPISKHDISLELLSGCILSFKDYFLLHGQSTIKNSKIAEKDFQNLLLLWLHSRLPRHLVTLREVEVGRGRVDLVIVSGIDIIPIEIKLARGNYDTRSMSKQLIEYMVSVQTNLGFLVIFEVIPNHACPQEMVFETGKVKIFRIPVGNIPSKVF